MSETLGEIVVLFQLLQLASLLRAAGRLSASGGLASAHVHWPFCSAFVVAEVGLSACYTALPVFLAEPVLLVNKASVAL
jgi:hypothetical protein